MRFQTLATDNGNELTRRHQTTLVKDQFQIYPLASIHACDHFNGTDPRRLKNYEVIWVREGEGILTIDLQEYTLQNNRIYCLSPGQYRSCVFAGAADGYYLSFSAEFLYLCESKVDFNFLMGHGIGKEKIRVVLSDPELDEVIVRINQEYTRRHPMSAEVLKGLLKVMMIYVSRRMETTVVLRDRDAEVVNKFMDLLRKHFTTKKLVSDYADELCITPNYLNSIVKRLTGFPVSHHIHQQIIMEAKRQVIYSGLRLKEVAEILGFEDYAHFSKFFKNYSGTNFSSFKKRYSSE
jgi:AraC-like DNA-binding protein